jgi:hypothetical protein
MTPASLTAVARHFLFVRETEGPNRGAWVSFFQRFCHGIDGDSWCADVLCVVLDIAYKGRVPLPRSGSTQVLLAAARAKGYVRMTPDVNDLYFFVSDMGVAHHVGIVTGVNPLTGIAGNTSETGLSSNGTGMFEHAITAPASATVFVRLPNEVTP